MLRSYTNWGVQIGNTQWRWQITNSYIQNSIVCETSIISSEEEINLLKRYDTNSFVANCLRWIGWERKNYESRVKREPSIDRSGNKKCQPWMYLLLPKVEVWNYLERSIVTCDSKSDRTYNARTQQNDPKRIWRQHTNSYKKQIIRGKNLSRRKKVFPLHPRYLGTRSIMYGTKSRYCLKPKLIT